MSQLFGSFVQDRKCFTHQLNSQLPLEADEDPVMPERRW